MSRSNLVYLEDEPADGEEELDEVEIDLQRLKRNRDRWNETLEDIEANLVEDQMVGRNRNGMYRTRKVYARDNFKQSCWYLFLQRDFSDLDSRNSNFFAIGSPCLTNCISSYCCLLRSGFLRKNWMYV